MTTIASKAAGTQPACAMAVDPTSTYLFLSPTGESEVVPGGNAFWSLAESEMDRFGHGWLVAEFKFAEDWPSRVLHVTVGTGTLHRPAVS